jgi:hypothetical protein
MKLTMAMSTNRKISSFLFLHTRCRTRLCVITHSG